MGYESCPAHAQEIRGACPVCNPPRLTPEEEAARVDRALAGPRSSGYPLELELRGGVYLPKLLCPSKP